MTDAETIPILRASQQTFAHSVKILVPALHTNSSVSKKPYEINNGIVTLFRRISIS